MKEQSDAASRSCRGSRLANLTVLIGFASCCRPLRPPSGCLYAASCATASATPDEVVEIFLSIVVGYFLSRRDVTQGYNHHPSLARYRLRIRPAGMVYVTRHVPSRRAVDGPFAVEFEHIFGALSLALLGFLGRNAPAAIGRDIGASLDHFRREQAEPGRRATEVERARGHCLRLAANFFHVIRNPQIVRSNDLVSEKRRLQRSDGGPRGFGRL
jgi:hypothetical protein